MVTVHEKRFQTCCFFLLRYRRYPSQLFRCPVLHEASLIDSITNCEISSAGTEPIPSARNIDYLPDRDCIRAVYPRPQRLQLLPTVGFDIVDLHIVKSPAFHCRIAFSTKRVETMAGGSSSQSSAWRRHWCKALPTVSDIGQVQGPRIAPDIELPSISTAADIEVVADDSSADVVSGTGQSWKVGVPDTCTHIVCRHK